MAVLFVLFFLVGKRLHRLLPHRLSLNALIDKVFSLNIAVPLGEGSLCEELLAVGSVAFESKRRLELTNRLEFNIMHDIITRLWGRTN